VNQLRRFQDYRKHKVSLIWYAGQEIYGQNN